MYLMGGLIGWILEALSLVAVAGGVFALVHAIRQRQDAFTAVNKLTKPIWIGILAASILVLLVSPLIGFLGLAGVIAISVYLVDVRPRVDEIQKPRW